MEIVKIAWRNLWRNKRRTLITTASVFFALWFALLLRAFQLGSYDLMVKNIVHSYSGYFQIHAKGYWKEQVLNNSFKDNPGIDKLLKNQKDITGFARRLESFALASYSMQTKSVMLAGIDPAAENQLIYLKKKLVSGEYLEQDDPCALVSMRLAKKLNVKPGDSLVIIGQGYHGTSAAGIYRVKGIIKLPSPDLDNHMVYLSLSQARNLFSADSLLTSIAVNVPKPEKNKGIAFLIRNSLDPETYEVMTWDQMMPDVVQQIKADNASGLIMLGILYIIVAFGVFGTTLMMLNERSREFGVMIALGMQKIRLTIIILTEILLLGLIGILTAIVAAMPLIYYFYAHPIRLTGSIAESTMQMGFEPLMPTIWDCKVFISQSLVILIIVIAMMILPILRIRKLNIIYNLRH